MSSVSSVNTSAATPVQDVARVAKAAQGAPELRRELLEQIAKRVGNGDYVKAELTAQTAEALAKSPTYQPGQVLHKVA